MLADPLWFTYSMSLLEGSLDRNDEMAFCNAMNALFRYVAVKSKGRCTSKSIFDENIRGEMIKNLFDLYHQNESTTTLCKSRFMRKITKHNKDNDENLKFIYQVIVPAQAKMAKHPLTILDEPAALLWIRELDATVVDPETVSNQKKMLKEVPVEMQEKLTIGRGKIGGDLVFAASKGWLNADKVGKIIEGLQSRVAVEKEIIELSEENAVEHFIQRYITLIASGGEYESSFLNSLLLGLNNLKKDPIFTK